MGVVPHWGQLEGSAKEIAEKLVTAAVDAVILTPGSPICNHSLAIIQRVLEAGLTTIALTLEPEMMKRVRVPRAMVVDFPPGCPVGEPTDHEKQRKVLREALEYLTTMTQPGTVWKSPFKWTRSCSAPCVSSDDYCNGAGWCRFGVTNHGDGSPSGQRIR